MVISATGINNIRDYEGLSLSPYIDDDKTTPGVEYSIGYGHQIQPGESYLMQGVTREQAEQLFINDVMKFSAGVNSYLKVPVPQSVYDSLVSFAYNIGLGNFSKSVLLSQINAGYDWQTVFDTWQNNWDATDSLATRRENEAVYAANGIPGDTYEPDTGNVPYNASNAVKTTGSILIPVLLVGSLLYFGSRS